MRHLLSIVLAGLLTACAQQQPHIKLYAGSEQPAERLVTVEVPPALEILDINGQPLPAANRMIGNQPRLLQFQPGEYRINAYYEQGFDVGGGLSHEVIRSKSATFNFKGKAGDNWKLNFVAPANLEEARELKTGFTGWAENSRTGERIATEEGPEHTSLLSLLSGSGGRAAYSAPNSVAPLDAQPVVPAVVPVNAPAQAGASLPHNDATLTTMQNLWLLLGPESREAFLRWANP